MLTAYLCGITCVNPVESQVPLYPEFAIGIKGDKDLDVRLDFPSMDLSLMKIWRGCIQLLL